MCEIHWQNWTYIGRRLIVRYRTSLKIDLLNSARVLNTPLMYVGASELLSKLNWKYRI